MAICRVIFAGNGIYAKNIWHILTINAIFFHFHSANQKSTSLCKLKFLQKWHFSKLKPKKGKDFYI